MKRNETLKQKKKLIFNHNGFCPMHSTCHAYPYGNNRFISKAYSGW